LQIARVIKSAIYNLQFAIGGARKPANPAPLVDGVLGIHGSSNWENKEQRIENKGRLLLFFVALFFVLGLPTNSGSCGGAPREAPAQEPLPPRICDTMRGSLGAWRSQARG